MGRGCAVRRNGETLPEKQKFRFFSATVWTLHVCVAGHIHHASGKKTLHRAHVWFWLKSPRPGFQALVRVKARPIPQAFCFYSEYFILFFSPYLLSCCAVGFLQHMPGVHTHTHTHTSTGNLCSVRRLKCYPFCCWCIIKGSVLQGCPWVASEIAGAAGFSGEITWFTVWS